MDLSNNFASPFTFNGTTVDQPGMYAVAYSLSSHVLQKAHQISLLVDYGELQLNQRHQPKIFFFNLDYDVVEPLCAVPFDVTKNIISSNKWLFLKTRRHWYSIFCDHLESFLINEGQIDPLPGNKKRSSVWLSHEKNPCNK